MALKPAILADFSKLPELPAQARAELGRSRGKQVKTEEHPKQMNLF
jgi:hypothetical protein